MKLAIDIPAETYKAISEWEKPNPKYAAEYMLYQFVKNGKRIEQTPCTDAISRSEAIRVASGYCHWTNIPAELAKLPSVNPIPCEDAISRQAVLDCLTATKLKKFDFIFQAREEIKNLPSVSTEKTGWIPVSEKLPEDHDWYVIVVKEKSTGYQYIPRIASHNHDNCWSIIDTEDADKEWLDDLECIAWMPLPPSYEPQESDNCRCSNCKYFGEILKDNIHSCNNNKSIFKACLETATGCCMFEPQESEE